mgnify:CR=1 FL=1
MAGLRCRLFQAGQLTLSTASARSLLYTAQRPRVACCTGLWRVSSVLSASLQAQLDGMPLTTPALSSLPTLDSQGLKGFNVSIWHGLYAPKGTPPAVTQKLNEALKTALKDPAFIKKTEDLGARLISDERVEPAAHKRFVRSEIDKWTPVIRAAGVYAD